MNRQHPARRAHPAVPKTWAVQPGAAVNIVLKADQPTGRTVSGTVQDVLTRGNHPRGIKVRLGDGRIGRVQSMATACSSSAGDPGGVVEGMRAINLGESGAAAESWRVGKDQDVRADEGSGLPAQQIGLEAYIKEAKPKRKGKGKMKGVGSSAAVAASEEDLTATTPPSAAPAPMEETATCPVCGEFEGDEAAVSHHVAGHFDAAP